MHRAPAPKGPQKLSFPGKDGGLIVLGDKPLVAETPEHLLDDETTPTRQILHPQQRPDPEPPAIPTPGSSPSTARSTSPLEIALGDLKKRFQPKTYRMVLECGGNGRSYFAPQAPGNQWTNGGVGLRRMDRRAARRRAQGRRRQGIGGLHRQLRADAHLSGDPST